MNCILPRCAVFLFALATQAALADEILVLNSKGASVVEGDVVGFETPLNIDENGQVILLLATGEELVVEGPFVGALGKSATVSTPIDLEMLRKILSPDYSADSVGALRTRLESSEDRMFALLSAQDVTRRRTDLSQSGKEDELNKIRDEITKLYETIGSDSGVVLPFPLTFAYESSELTKGAKSQLDAISREIESLDRLPNLEIVGHSDKSAAEAQNLALSKRRAVAVAGYLLERVPDLQTHVSIVARGSSELFDRENPLNPLNRRVVIVRLSP